MSEIKKQMKKIFRIEDLIELRETQLKKLSAKIERLKDKLKDELDAQNERQAELQHNDPSFPRSYQDIQAEARLLK